MIVFLIGYMGCGKSSLGRKIAARTGFDFIDMDRQIEQRYGTSVSEIFAAKGQAWFRDEERQTLLEFEDLSADTIVATGGGAPCFGDNMQTMKRIGKTVYLKMSPEKIVGRLSPRGREKRPIIRGMNDEQLLCFIKENLPQREQYYNDCSVVIDCDALSDNSVIDYIVQEIKR